MITFGLRAKFLAVGILIVLTTVAATAWTLVVLSRVASSASATLADTDAITASTAAIASALEREDDALLVVLDGGSHDLLVQARTRTDVERTRLAPGIAELEAPVLAYRRAVDELVARPSERTLERYHRDANPLLRAAIAEVGRARDRRFEEARTATTRAHDEAMAARSVVLMISALALAIAAFVALRLARHVLVPMRALAIATKAIRDGKFDARVEAAPRDEIGQVADAFNDMARRLGEFHRSNLGEVLRAKTTLEAMMHALPDAVLLADADANILSINPAAAKLFANAQRPAPTTLTDLAELAPESSALRGALTARARLDQVAVDQVALDQAALEAALRIDIAGDLRRFLPRVIPLGVAPGGVVVVLSDVTELVRLDEMRTELVALASHELRTPVTTLRMSLMLLREAADGLEPRVRDLVHTALGGVDQLAEIVDEQLDLTRIEAGKLRLTQEPIDLARLVDDVVTRSRSRADELGVTITVEATSPAVLGDRARLRIVVDNILNNALKYTPSGGTIVIALSAHAGAVEVAVTDSGRGIPPELRSRVFEKFFRVEHHRPGSETTPRGSGIGLYLCKEIVELHGGTIRCEDVP
ncbi:MAG: ATP-binding protein, partial [Kofleriaceae bacterium]